MSAFTYMKIGVYFILLFLLSFNANGESGFYTGIWEYTIEIKVPGMPQSDLKKVQKCIREVNDVISLFKPEPSCSINQVQVSESQVRWRLYCKTQGGTYNGEAQINGDERSLQGSVDMQTTIPGMKNIMRTSYIITGINKGKCQ
jgi:small-conductance mechanosensitive channel